MACLMVPSRAIGQTPGPDDRVWLNLAEPAGICLILFMRDQMPQGAGKKGQDLPDVLIKPGLAAELWDAIDSDSNRDEPVKDDESGI